MKRKIPALLLALLLVFSAALPASAAGRACLRSSPASACTRLPACWRQLVCDRLGLSCGGSQTPSGPSAPGTPSEPEQPDAATTEPSTSETSEPETSQPDPGGIRVE